MFDTLQIVFWSITYCLIIFFDLKHREDHAFLMPPIAGVFNLAWELNAAIHSLGFWGHLVWLLLDLVIFSNNVRKMTNHIYIY